MHNQQHEKHFEKPLPIEEHLVAGKPILSSEDNAVQQRLEKQSTARAHRFTKGDNVFAIDLANGKSVTDMRPQDSDSQATRAHDKWLLAQNSPDSEAKVTRTPLRGEISNDVESVILPRHAVKFTRGADGHLIWNTIGHWSAKDWQTQNNELLKYFSHHADRQGAIFAEIQSNGGALTVGIEAHESKPVPPPRPIENTDRFQWLKGSGYINGQEVNIGGDRDAKIPASARPNTPIVLSTIDGSGTKIHGHLMIDQQGRKFFYPDYSEDAQHRCYAIQNPRQNKIPLTNAGVATY